MNIEFNDKVDIKPGSIIVCQQKNLLVVSNNDSEALGGSLYAAVNLETNSINATGSTIDNLMFDIMRPSSMCGEILRIIKPEHVKLVEL